MEQALARIGERSFEVADPHHELFAFRVQAPALGQLLEEPERLLSKVAQLPFAIGEITREVDCRAIAGAIRHGFHTLLGHVPSGLVRRLGSIARSLTACCDG
jgi:hypothetical protein